MSPEVSAARAEKSARSRAADLVAFARAHAFNCGIERSFKMTPRGLDAERFLLSFATADDPSWRRKAVTGLRGLGLPVAAVDALAAELPRARFLHLGYEAPDGVPGFKVYLEFDPAQSDVVHRSYKWNGDGVVSVDEYRLCTDEDRWSRMMGQLGNAPEPFRRAVDGFADIAATRIAAEEQFHLEVSRVGGQRVSFDLRLYAAGLHLTDAGGLLAPVATYCSCGPPFARHMMGHGAEALGHVAAGAAAGTPFITVYHGAEALQ